MARRRSEGRPGAGQRRDVHDLRRPRDHRRLEHLREVAPAGSCPRLRAGDPPQRADGLRRLPGLGQRPDKFRHEGSRHPQPEAEWHPNEKLLAAITTHVEAIAAPTAATLDKIDVLLGLDKPRDEPEGGVRLRRPRPEVQGAGARHPHPTDLQGRRPRAAQARRRESRRPAARRARSRTGASCSSSSRPCRCCSHASSSRCCSPIAATGLRPQDPHVRTGGPDATRARSPDSWAASTRTSRAGEPTRSTTSSSSGGWAPTAASWCSPETCTSPARSRSTSGARTTRRSTRGSCSARRQLPATSPATTSADCCGPCGSGSSCCAACPAERIAWEGDHGVVLPAGASIRPGRRGRLRRKPAILPGPGLAGRYDGRARRPTGVGGSRWSGTSARSQPCRQGPRRSRSSAGTPATSSRRTPRSAPATRQVALDPKDPVRLMVFRNNLGLVSFARDGADYRVAHTLLSNVDDETGDEFTEHARRLRAHTHAGRARPEGGVMAEEKKKKRNVFQKIARLLQVGGRVGRGDLLRPGDRHGDPRGPRTEHRQPRDPGGRGSRREAEDRRLPREGGRRRDRARRHDRGHQGARRHDPDVRRGREGGRRRRVGRLLADLQAVGGGLAARAEPQRLCAVRAVRPDPRGRRDRCLSSTRHRSPGCSRARPTRTTPRPWSPASRRVAGTLVGRCSTRWSSRSAAPSTRCTAGTPSPAPHPRRRSWRRARSAWCSTSPARPVWRRCSP